MLIFRWRISSDRVLCSLLQWQTNKNAKHKWKKNYKLVGKISRNSVSNVLKSRVHAHLYTIMNHYCSEKYWFKNKTNSWQMDSNIKFAVCGLRNFEYELNMQFLIEWMEYTLFALLFIQSITFSAACVSASAHQCFTLIHRNNSINIVGHALIAQLSIYALMSLLSLFCQGFDVLLFCTSHPLRSNKFQIYTYDVSRTEQTHTYFEYDNNKIDAQYQYSQFTIITHTIRE